MEKSRGYSASKLHPVKVFFYGIFMGIADIIPGVSGGTVAFITGIYHDLLSSIKSFDKKALSYLFRLKFKELKHHIPFKFVIPILLGISVSLIACSHAIQFLLSQEAYRGYLFGVFFGLILASIYICIKKVELWSYKEVVGFILGIVFAFFITNYQKPAVQEPLYDVPLGVYAARLHSKSIVNYRNDTQMAIKVPKSHVAVMMAKEIIHPETSIYSYDLNTIAPAMDLIKPQKPSYFRPDLIGAGILAVSAMLLPGISGSYVLNILGYYPIIIGAIADLTSNIALGILETDAFMILLNMGVGILVGLIFVSRALSWLLHRFRTITLASLIGVMIGSIRSVWPFCIYEAKIDPTKPLDGAFLVSIKQVLPSLDLMHTWGVLLIFACAFLSVLFFELIFDKKRKLLNGSSIGRS